MLFLPRDAMIALHVSFTSRYWFTAKWQLFSQCLFVCLFACAVYLSRLLSDFDQTRTHAICLGL